MVSRKNKRFANVDISDNEKNSAEISSGFLSILILISACLLVGFFNYAHVSYMQENNVMFSHLSNLERELSFRTEMGFYYSFFKQAITSSSLKNIFTLLVSDNITEYPDTINALQRFNVYPELILGIMYKKFILITQALGIQTRTCYMVNRDNLPSVQSCEGIGEPPIFYVNMVMLLNGVMMSFLFLIGYIVSGNSYLGAFITCILYFFNHRECTRVQWTPPLRENFSYPYLIIQQYFLLVIMKKKNYDEVSFVTKVGFMVSTLMSLLSWQFAQFALLTQCVAIFLANLIAGNDDKKIIIRKVFVFIIISDIANLILQFGNTLLLTGPLRPCLIMAWLITTYEPHFLYRRFRNSILSPLRWIVLFAALLSSTMILKYLTGYVLNIKSDDHMFDILQSKFTNFTSFDSLLYTCAPEFDFYDISSVFELLYTGLLPMALCSMVIILLYLIYKWAQFFCSRTVDCSVNQISATGFCDVNEFYLFFQTIAYVVIAGLIMRLKLFATPHLCIMSSLLCHPKWPLVQLSDKLSSKLFQPSQSRLLKPLSKKFHFCWIIVVLSICSVKGLQNLRAEWSIQGSYSNWEQEQLMNYITGNTKPGDSFVGQMATMATVRLVTGRPVIIHPHYENEQLRERVHLAYSVYSKKTIREIWLLLRSKLQAKYLVYEHALCRFRPEKPGCSYLEIWDIEEPDRAKNQPVCLYFEEFVRDLQMSHRLGPGSSALRTYFKWKFTSENVAYSLFEVLDVPE